MTSGSIFTRAAQAGYHPQPGETPAPAVPPITMSAGYLHAEMRGAEWALGYDGDIETREAGYVYGRHGTPTHALLEDAIADLEGAEAALSFSSGMAAIHAALISTVHPGGVVLAARQLYGVSRVMLDRLDADGRINVRYASFANLNDLKEAAETQRPVAFFCEPLTNPLARVLPLKQIAGLAGDFGAALLVDNTFATPYLLRPLELGAALVIHSTTKSLNGHGDITGGVIAGDRERLIQAFGVRKLFGAIPSPFDAWLTLRGLRTFALRMRQACNSAGQIAAWLATQPGIARVWYPGLPIDPDYELARQLFEGAGAGAILAFDLAEADRSAAFAFIEKLKLVRAVTSLGDLNSLVLHPASSSHRALTPEQRAALGIQEGTVRLSVGIEDPTDLIDDLQQALT